MDKILHNFQMQLAEIELLQSMYSQDEFKFHDDLILDEIRSWIDHPIDEIPNTISFVLKLDKFQIYGSFPHDYPGDKCCEIIVRSNDLKRDAQSKINKDLELYIENVFEPDSAIVTDVVQFLQEDNIQEYFQDKTEVSENNEIEGNYLKILVIQTRKTDIHRYSDSYFFKKWD